MCNNTSLSHFLEGVNFLDEDMNMDDFELEDKEEDFLCEDGNLLMLDMEMDEVLDASSSNLELPSETLPPLIGELDYMMDTLLSPPLDEETPEMEGTPSLEKLANALRQSEQTKTKFKLTASPSPALAKANPFFTGSRVTITPELEKSRQQLWDFVRMQQQAHMTHKAPFTAAA